MQCGRRTLNSEKRRKTEYRLKECRDSGTRPGGWQAAGSRLTRRSSPSARNQLSDPRRCARRHGARRPSAPFGAARRDRLAQPGRHRVTARARVNMPFDGPTTGGRQVAIQIARQFQQQCTAARRWARRDGHFVLPPRSAWSWTRARCSRVLTLSSEIPNTCATSRVDKPSISRRNTIAR